MAHGTADNVAHVDVGDLLDGDLGLLDSGLDGGCAQLRGRDGLEGAIELVKVLEHQDLRKTPVDSLFIP